MKRWTYISGILGLSLMATPWGYASLGNTNVMLLPSEALFGLSDVSAGPLSDSWRPSEQAQRLVSAGSGEVIITEVMYDPGLTDDIPGVYGAGEWIELYNPGDVAVDIGGFTLHRELFDGSGEREHTITGNPLVQPGEYFIVASQSDLGNALLSTTADYVWPDVGSGTSFFLHQTENRLELFDDEGSLVSGTEFVDDGETGSGVARQLAATLLDEVYVELGETWCPAEDAIGGATDLGTPGAVNIACDGVDVDGDGYFTDEEDCDDDEATANYDGTEVFDDDIDNDCDGITDGELTLFIEDSPIDSDFTGDGNTDNDGELLSFEATWDQEDFLFAFDFELSDSENAIIWYFDLDLAGGETDFNNSRPDSDGGTYGNGDSAFGAYPTDVQHSYGIDLMLAAYADGSFQLYKVVDNFTTDVTAGATYIERSEVEGTDEERGEVLVPWSTLYGDAGLSSTVPTNAVLHVVGVIRRFDNEGAADLAPDNISYSPIDTYLELQIDVDADGEADVVREDADGDGFSVSQGDCDDLLDTVYPGAGELCDGLDNDCDDDIDTDDADGLIEIPLCELTEGVCADTYKVESQCQDGAWQACQAADYGVDYEGANESSCDGMDGDCDGSVDEGLATTYYEDSDDDGFGDVGSSQDACSAPPGYVDDSSDCNDSDDAIPGDNEILCNGLDDDCEVGTVDAPNVDGDAYDVCDTGDAGNTDGLGVDCDDNDSAINPGAAETTCNGEDDDCDAGTVDAPDDDGDSFDVCGDDDGVNPDGNDEDCDDSNSDAFPDADEVCDTADNDCDGAADESSELVIDDNQSCELNLGVCNGSTKPGYLCDDGSWSTCTDTQYGVAYEATEVSCDGLDNDCDGSVDEGIKTTFYYDADQDGYGTDDSLTVCEAEDDYTALQSGDCNDNDDAINPDSTWYIDFDSDGFGADSDFTANQCATPPGSYALNNTDCDNEDADVYPGADEICNDGDDDCDDSTDEGFDVDNDGFFDCPSQGLAVDCNDGDEDIYPGATEVCDGVDTDCDGEGDNIEFDSDSDGHINSEIGCPAGPIGGKAVDDCNDGDGTIYNGAAEICDLKDNDCDGDVDEGDGVLGTYYPDGDGDGFGVTGGAVEACGAPNGYVETPGDCEDGDDTVYPGGNELCDEKDNDCDLSVDEGALQTYYYDKDSDGYGNCDVAVEACEQPSEYVANCEDCDDNASDINPDTVWYLDGDADGFGRSTITQVVCEEPTGYVDNSNDCNDVDDEVYPGAVETCNDNDDDCDSKSDEGFDEDGDSYYQCVHDGNLSDCNDEDGTVNPGANEICDGKDNDCNSVGDDSVFDADGDGHLDDDAGCSVSSVAGKPVDDCNDGDDSIYTGAVEVCDGKDNGCDGEGDLLTFDQDNDGQLDDSASCPSNLGKAPIDCDDTDDEIGTDFEEVCDGKDNDCDGKNDASDGFDVDGDTSLSQACCDSGYVESCDCDDDDSNRAHNKAEICDGEDNDCDVTVDEDTSVDSDGDGITPCDGDCDDGADHIYPGALEVCDGKDSNCDGDKLSTEVDDDGDGFINCDNVITGTDGDCNDDEVFTYPGADELCDLKDNDCDETVDEGAKSTFYADVDEDSYGDDAQTALECEAPEGYVVRGGDCDDEDPERVPGGTEICDAKDNDCGESDGDASIDEGYDLDGLGGADCTDDDGDGLTESGGDCNDDNPDIYIGAPEDPEDGSNAGDALDNDCDGTIDEGTLRFDDDDDGYCEAAGGPDNSCQGVTFDGDCDDSEAQVNPGEAEICEDGIDQDCMAGDLSCDEFDDDLDGFVENPSDGSPADCDDGADCDDLSGEELDACLLVAAAINPDADEIQGNAVDENCDGYVDDADGDGYGVLDGDCNDNAYSVNPGVDEVPGNDQDENCDEIVEDIDFDGYNDISISGDDCNDGAECLALSTEEETLACLEIAAQMNPGGTDICGDGIDQDCSGVDLSCVTFDDDGDGYVEEPEDGQPADCDDGAECASISDGAEQAACYAEAAAIHPGADEIPGNDVDENCDGIANDVDGDGQDATEIGGDDCDDNNAIIFDGAEEDPDGTDGDELDNDCDGKVDEGTLRYDDDGDGYCEALGGPFNTCEGDVPVGDCDDADTALSPEGVEICGDGIDQDCSGVDLPCDTVDLDGDGYAGGEDCNDDPEAGGIDSFPGAPELCDDALDNNCNGLVNENCRQPGYFGACSTSGTTPGDAWLAMLAILLPTFILRRRRTSTTMG